MTHEAADVRPGDVIAGRYRVEKILGTGSMGMVVAARHVDLLDLRAIKFMLPSALSNAEAVERFLREARAAATLKNDHVAKVYDVGRLDNGALYMIMEYLEGADLRRVLDERGALPIEEAVRYVIEACEGLAEAHAAGIVHRDIKPANLFRAQGAPGVTRIKVLDFGIAKVLGAAGAQLTTMMLGSPLYMSPEQIRSSRSVDARTDIWSLGVLLYECLAGKVPFGGTTLAAVCTAICTATPLPPTAHRRDIPPALAGVVLRCLDKDPSMRFSTVTQLAAALAPFGGKEASSSRPELMRGHVDSFDSLPTMVQPRPAVAGQSPQHAQTPMPAQGADSSTRAVLHRHLDLPIRILGAGVLLAVVDLGLRHAGLTLPVRPMWLAEVLVVGGAILTFVRVFNAFRR